MRGHEPEALVEAVGVLARPVGGQLHAVATEGPRLLDRLAHQRRADAGTSMLGLHVHGLDLGAEAAPPMDVTEHDELADAHDLVAELSHEHGSDALVDLVEGRSVEGEVAALRRRLPRDGTTHQELDDPGASAAATARLVAWLVVRTRTSGPGEEG